jgi:ribosomal protein S27AE
MAFGILNVIGGIVSSNFQAISFPFIVGLLVGGIWFAFGYYGGLPLVNTVYDWQPPNIPNEITDCHRQGLLVLRRRKRIMWASVPCYFVVGAILMPWLEKLGHPDVGFILIATVMAIIFFRYYLSRCPRCGYGFFAGSTNRAALIHRRNYCAYCGLSLDGQNRSKK